MPLKPLDSESPKGYNDMKLRVIELARRMNVITEMTVEPIEFSGTPKFNFSDKSSRLDLPSLDELITRLDAIEEVSAADLEECEEALEECTTALAAAEAQLEAIEAILTPTPIDDGTSGAWSHTTGITYGCSGTTNKVSGTLTGNISVELVSGSTYEITRVNSPRDCVDDGGISRCVTGSVQIGIYTRPDLTGSISLAGLSGDPGQTSSINKSISDGTYYVMARGENLTPNCGDSQYNEGYQKLGTFTISAGTITREYVVPVSVDEEGNIL